MKKSTFTVARTYGQSHEVGVIIGAEFGVHRDDGSYSRWAVTHLRSGFRIGSYRATRAEAITWAKRYAALPIDWSSRHWKFGVVPSKKSALGRAMTAIANPDDERHYR